MSHVHGPDCNHGDGEGQVQTINIADANQAPPLYKNIANYLRDHSKSGMRQKQGVFNGKRVDYFKGKYSFFLSSFLFYFCFVYTFVWMDDNRKRKEK